MKSPIWALVVVAVALGPLVPITAQGTTGEIRGTVVDFRGQPLTAPTVELRGPGVYRSSDLDRAGTYRFSALPAGEYVMTIGAQMFHDATIRSIRLRNNEVRVLPPIELTFAGFECNPRIPSYFRPLDQPNTAEAVLGGIVSAEHQPTVAQANVVLIAPEAGVISSTTTDREGHFSFNASAKRRDYRIEISKPGYFTEEFTDFAVQVGFETVYGLDLQPCPPGRCQPSLKPIRVLPGCA